MSGQLNSLGVIKAFADTVGGAMTSLNMHWMPLFGLLHLAFFYLHYMFASQTAHVGALYSAFCAMMLSVGACCGVGITGRQRELWPAGPLHHDALCRWYGALAPGSAAQRALNRWGGSRRQEADMPPLLCSARA